MAATKSRATHRLIAILATTIVAVVVADGATLLVRGNKAKPVSVDQAVKRFRATGGASPTPTPRPTPTHTKASATPAPVDTAVPSAPSTEPTTEPVEPISPTTQQPVAPVTTPTVHSSPPQQASPTATPTPSPSPSPSTVLSPSGVYRYATTGSEQVGIPGGKRSFPAETTITVQPSGCGVSSIWIASTQHSETQVLCTHGDGVRLASYQTKVGFYGVTSSESYTCPHNAIVYSAKWTVGATNSYTCTSSDASIAQKVTDDGFATLNVAGTPVRTLHIHIDATLSGADSGTSQQDFWLATSNSLIVRKSGSVNATQNGIAYTSSFNLKLQSLAPRR